MTSHDHDRDHDHKEESEIPLSESTAPPPIEPEPHQRTSQPPEPELELQPKTKETVQPLSKHPSTHLYTLSYLVFFAIFGTLARLGLQSLTFYTGAPIVTGVLWANASGSLLMGFFLEDKNLFREEWGENRETITEHERLKAHKATKKTIPLYIGLTTGFCGCFTSFSSFIRDVFLALANDLPDPSRDSFSGPVSRNGGYSFMALVAILLITVSLSLAALVAGAHLALTCDRLMPVLPFRFTRRILDPVIVVLGWGCWLGAVFMAIWPPDRHSPGTETWRGAAIFAIVFAPLGCLLRLYLSLFLNAKLPSFPLGTFAANILGTGILGMCYDLQHVGGISASVVVSCQVLQGVMDGFCGSLTTISTWVAELNGLSKRRHAYFYGTVSVGVGLGLLIVIMGSLLWTRGFDTPMC
ncbi:FluC/FEX family fluoride channel [Aspergillus chevalieri]|uniref:Chromosome condensation protein n=1 Tax=Aspergillus chevalieri TaxID=182096 RepID=A0A7R7ZRM8_ASPCH|nr:uncharacterized protein ACHE_60383A [Aspergillus chevalieri]BCR90497.1 hypothetical protein ACHE_60383A [Aspergillus chevalieri]